MPEYLAPGVFVEETSFRAKSIQGVGTSTTAFVGPTRKGPLGLASDVITSFGEFERIYGGIADLNFASPIGQMPNYMAHAVKAFFDNGGARLYVARVFTSTQVTNPASANLTANSAAATIASNGGTVGTFQARYPGAGANGTISAYLKRSPASATTLGAAPVGSMAQLTAGDGTISFFVKDGAGIYQPETPAGDGSDVLNTGNPGGPLELLTLNLELMTGGSEAEGAPILLEGLGFDAAHPRYLGNALPVTPASRGELLAAPYAFIADPAATAFSLRDALFGGGDSSVLPVTGGVDGEALRVSDASRNIVSYSEALTALEEIPDISIIAAPGSSVTAEAAAINNELITHCERLRYRVAILDTPQGQSVSEARAVRAAIDSSHAALYYPWVVVPNPSARPSNASIPKEIALPPSGFVAGIYARTDIQRGVWKAPANEVVRGALRFEREVSKGEQEVLNPEG
ncbi:MAG: phage tail sheath subtilisin-like domain-containing protein, partial [Mangrovicoccus sp.]